MNGRPVGRVFTDYYCPIEAGYKDRSGVLPYDKAASRAAAATYRPPKHVKHSADRTVFVGRLPRDAEEEDLRKMFGRFGDVREIRLARDVVTGAPRGYAFVVFGRRRDVATALAACRRLCILGADVVVEPEHSRTLRDWRPRRLGGGLGGKKESGQLRFGGSARPFIVRAVGEGRPAGFWNWQKPGPERQSSRGTPTDPSGSRRHRDDDMETDADSERPERSWYGDHRSTKVGRREPSPHAEGGRVKTEREWRERPSRKDTDERADGADTGTQSALPADTDRSQSEVNHVRSRRRLAALDGGADADDRDHAVRAREPGSSGHRSRDHRSDGERVRGERRRDDSERRREERRSRRRHRDEVGGHRRSGHDGRSDRHRHDSKHRHT